MSLRKYANIDYEGQVHQTHYRHAGSGPPLILLHPSPLSSRFMQPLVELFEGMAEVLAPDTPGYGASDPLPRPGNDLSVYADWLKRFMAAQGIGSAGIYGSATGAQIAVQFARSFPESTDFLVLDNAVHFPDADRQRIMKDYFPDLSPRPDGSHLQVAWNMASRLYHYFPWFDQGDESRVSDQQPPPERVHATVLDYLLAGQDYDRAYRAAFNYEKAQNIQAIQRPTRIIRWKGSYVRRYADLLDDFEWPEHIRMVHCEASIESRYQALVKSIAELTA